MKKLGQWLRVKDRLVWIEYTILALIILLPLLLPGYILTLDLVFTPHFSWPAELTNAYPLEGALWLLHLFLPGDIIEKIILFLILVLSGVGMHLVFSRLKRGDISPDIWRFGAYFAGVFYMINPFTYSRFMAGQWMVLAGYALLPFFVLSVWKLLQKPSLGQSLKVALWGVVITIFSLHHIGIMAIIGLLLIVVELWGRKKADLKRYAKYLSLVFLFGLLLTSFWWLPALIGQGALGQALGDFNQQDAAAFATRSDGSLGAFGDVIRLQGFWAEGQRLYALPQDIVPLWGIWVLLLWALIFVGTVKAWRSQRRTVVVALGAIVVGCILAVTPLVSWLAQITPPLGGYREPHKFVSLVAFGYAILGGLGLAYLAEWARRKRWLAMGQVAMCFGLLLPIIITPTMFWGFAGQLSPRQYPAEWHEVNKELTEKTLFLPWHQYMNYSFTRRIIAGPAEKFFTAPILASDDPEFRGISSTVPNKEKRDVGEVLKSGDSLIAVLRKYNVQRILLAKEDDHEKYSYLDDTKGLRLLLENSKVKLYAVEGGTP